MISSFLRFDLFIKYELIRLSDLILGDELLFVKSEERTEHLVGEREGASPSWRGNVQRVQDVVRRSSRLVLSLGH